MSGTLIIGYGNPLRHDDGLGWQAIAELENRPEFSNTKLHGCHQLTPELAESVSKADRVIFVDASRTANPGELFWEKIALAFEAPRFTHEFTPATLLKLGKELYGVSPTAFVVGIGGESFEIGEGLSAKVLERIPELVEKISELRLDIETRLLASCQEHGIDAS